MAKNVKTDENQDILEAKFLNGKEKGARSRSQSSQEKIGLRPILSKHKIVIGSIMKSRHSSIGGHENQEKLGKYKQDVQISAKKTERVQIGVGEKIQTDNSQVLVQKDKLLCDKVKIWDSFFGGSSLDLMVVGLYLGGASMKKKNVKNWRLN